MAVVDIPPPRTIMVREDGKLIRHDRKIAVFPDWRNMSQRYSGTLSFSWGGLSETQTYDNNYLTWIEPWQTKPSLPSGGIAFRAVPLLPIYVLNMSGQHYSASLQQQADWTSGEFSAAVDLCEEQFGVTFVCDYDQRCAWAFAKDEGESDSEQVLNGYLCCACEVRRDDFEGAATLCGGDDACVVAVALDTEKERDELFWFEDGVLWSEFTLGAQTSCKGIMLYRMDGTSKSFPASNGEYSSPGVPVLLEIRQLIPQALPAYNSSRTKTGAYRRKSNEIPGELSGAGGRPFVEASF